MSPPTNKLPRYSDGIAAALLGARESVMAPIRPILRAHDLTEQQWRLLRVLIDIGPMEISQAAQASMIMPPSVTRILKDLQERALVAKSSNLSDRRKSTISITAAGKNLVHQTARETSKLLSGYRSRFGDKRFNDLITELQAFSAIITQPGLPDE